MVNAASVLARRCRKCDAERRLADATPAMALELLANGECIEASGAAMRNVMSHVAQVHGVFTSEQAATMEASLASEEQANPIRRRRCHGGETRMESRV